MKVLLVSECTKHAIVETQRIIDQFAERKGRAIWETIITQQGLDTLKKLLKSTARKNTAVACHLIKPRQQTELLWIVGNHKQFNQEGNVPTNITSKDILKAKDENQWRTNEGVAISASIAGLFHDFGKANALFQRKLNGKAKKSYEPFRHEWMSLILFKVFVGNHTDEGWINKLAEITEEEEELILRGLLKEKEQIKNNPLKDLPPIAKYIAWLILSHHRLPQYPEDCEPRLRNIDLWQDKSLSANWNSPFCDDEWDEEDRDLVFSFPEGTPIKSKTWRKAARRAGIRAQKYLPLMKHDWFKDRFSLHLARLALMLSDHFYSSSHISFELQDMAYSAYANTDRKTRLLKQRLDEHNIGVAKNAFFIAKTLPTLSHQLPAIYKNKSFKKRNKEKHFIWQDKAFDLACSLKESSKNQGFFGVNLASTGCGKTLANARIMYGLSDENLGCRFSIALGLRILTLQTGDALREKLSLGDDDLAVIIGSTAIQQLYESMSENPWEGSESAEELIEEQDYISYEGSIEDTKLGYWLSDSPKIRKLLSAPILVCTIDNLIKATEGLRGGKQIAPILRLLTSDLILDEPDDFDLADLPALCRLVNFAGVFGSRVLLSSATLAPSIIKALFEAYYAGREIYNQSCGQQERANGVCCVWFDEFDLSSSNLSDSDAYLHFHQKFIEERVINLSKQKVLRKGVLSPPIEINNTKDAAFVCAESIRQAIYSLHQNHHQICSKNDKKMSIGIVRMANINSMISVVKQILIQEVEDEYCLHFCVYHSRFPLLIRSKIEETLDRCLSRHDSEKMWKQPEVERALASNPAKNHVFIVFATSVAEVGRDHDYDWAVIEPSSMRSIIQLAGRVQRHRRIVPLVPNIVILRKNYKSLEGSELAYVNPGFESKDYKLTSKDLSISLKPSQYEEINAIPRLCSESLLNFDSNLVDLEHKTLEVRLFGDQKPRCHASLWWKHDPDWCGVIQKMTPFRKTTYQQKEYFYLLSDEEEAPRLHEWPQGGRPISVEDIYFSNDRFKPGKGIYPWIHYDISKEIKKISEKLDMTLEEASIKFARLSLRELSAGDVWVVDPLLGFYNN